MNAITQAEVLELTPEPERPSRALAEAVAEAINDSQPNPMDAPRFFKVVEDGYQLQPGFEP